MKVYIEDVTENYGTHGVSVYSLVHGMTAYVAEVRASGTTLFTSEGYGEGAEIDDSDAPEEVITAKNNLTRSEK